MVMMGDGAPLLRRGDGWVSTPAAPAPRTVSGRRDGGYLEGVGTLAGGVAHHFNSLLTVIRSHAAFAREGGPQVAADLAAIEEATVRGAELVRALELFARRQAVLPTPVQLNRWVQQAGGQLRAGLPRNVSLVLRLSPETWAVEVDPAQLEVLLEELVRNAEEAMPDGGTLTLATGNVVVDDAYVAAQRGVTPGAYAVLAVEDTGRGIAPAVLPRIFEPFFTTKPVGTGPGLGLSTCHGIAHRAGGGIGVQSSRGAGTRAHVYQPRRLGGGGGAVGDGRGATQELMPPPWPGW